MKWAKALTKVLSVEIPWLSLQPLICPANADGTISYIPFLERYRVKGAVDQDTENELLSKISHKFLAFGPTLDHAFKVLALSFSLLTVFSASNYCGKSMNKAAFVVLAVNDSCHNDSSHTHTHHHRLDSRNHSLMNRMI